MSQYYLSVEEDEYLKSLIISDVETRDTEGPLQCIAKDVYDLIVEKYLYQTR